MKAFILPLALFALLRSSPAFSDTAQKIVLTPAMAVNETGFGVAGALVDEQTIAGDPKSGKGGAPKTAWFPEWTAWHYPAKAYLDLGRDYRLTDVYLYDGEGSGLVTISTGKPFAWTPLLTDDLSHYNVWNAHTVAVTTRYLEVVLRDAGSKVPEIVLYGTPVGQLEKPPTPIADLQPTMDQMIGSNAFIDDPLDKMTVGGFVREYHNWDWDEGDSGAYPGYPKNQNKWNPSYGAGGGWNFDEYYAHLKAAGITVCPAIQGGVAWLRPAGQGKSSDKPLIAGQDTALPASYAAHADHLFQYAARYGNTAVPDAELKLAPGQPRRSGLGLLHYFENWNEEDGWWGGREAYFQPEEFAAMCSADYDGDLGRMGKTFGIKNADPSAKLVMGGLAGLDLDYIKTMKAWADTHRGGSFPCDALNFHHYENTGGEQQLGQCGISPEAGELREKAAALVDYCHRNLPGKEVWMTEFGYDTNPKSPQRAPAISRYSQEEVQAQWLVRSYLALAAAGVDRAAMYMLRDVNAADPTQFSSSGLTSSKDTGWVPKPSWFYVHTLHDKLSGMRFVNEIPSINPKVKVYRFGSVSKTGGAYAVWCPTSDGTTVPGYHLTLSGAATAASQITLTPGKPSGITTPLSLLGKTVSIDVSERPVIVLVNRF